VHTDLNRAIKYRIPAPKKCGCLSAEDKITVGYLGHTVIENSIFTEYRYAVLMLLLPIFTEYRYAVLMLLLP
jgi:hypothetical protein